MGQAVSQTLDTPQCPGGGSAGIEIELLPQFSILEDQMPLVRKVQAFDHTSILAESCTLLLQYSGLFQACRREEFLPAIGRVGPFDHPCERSLDHRDQTEQPHPGGRLLDIFARDYATHRSKRRYEHSRHLVEGWNHQI